MLKSNELKVGNLISITSSAHKDDIEMVTSFMLQQIENGYKVFPIPINKEWFYKLEKQLIEIGFEYSHSETTNRLFIYIGNFTYQCSFIHQFQNLYFDLTTTELAIA